MTAPDPTATDPVTALLAETLDDHYASAPERDCIEGKWIDARRCDCGWVGTTADWFAHVAAVQAAALADAGLLVEGVTTVEWLVDCPDHNSHQPTDEVQARWSASNSCPNATLMRRTRTTYPDRVTDWTEYAEDTTGGMG